MIKYGNMTCQKCGSHETRAVDSATGVKWSCRDCGYVSEQK